MSFKTCCTFLCQHSLHDLLEAVPSLGSVFCLHNNTTTCHTGKSKGHELNMVAVMEHSLLYLPSDVQALAIPLCLCKLSENKLKTK